MKRWIIAFLIAMALVLSGVSAWAVDVTLAWDANTEDDLAGYRLFYRPQGGYFDYNNPIWEGGVMTDPRVTVSVQGDGDFVCRAFDRGGLESEDSNIATLDEPPAAPRNLTRE